MAGHSELVEPFDIYRDLLARSRAAAEVRMFKNNLDSVADAAEELNAALAGSGWRAVSNAKTEGGMGGFYLVRD